MSQDEASRRELEYYKRQLDELTGDNLRLDYAASGLRHEVLQRRAAFTILSHLQQTIGAHTDISKIFELVVPAINATLGMERTVVLLPTAEERAYRPGHWLGYRAEEGARLAEAVVSLPAEIVDTGGTIIVNTATPPAPWIEFLRAALQLPLFVLVPVAGEQAPIAWLASGRLTESRPLYPPLDRGDLEAFQAIAGLITASIRTMRVTWLEHTATLKSEFFANISHEFRTPITLTLGPLEHVLSGRLGALPPAARDRLLMIKRNQERLLNLVDQVLDLAKVEAGGARRAVRRVVHINRAIERRLAPFVPIAEQRGLVFSMRFDSAADAADLYLDREMFNKLLTNLVSNAFKFTRRGSIDLTTRIRDGNFLLEVVDTGIGIKADQLPHIFDRFRQADGSESRDCAGTGIGLALVKEVAILHGGEIVVLSDYGKGSSFRVCIPLGRQHLDQSVVAEGVEPCEDEPPPASVAAEGAADAGGAATLNRESEARFDPRKATVLYVEDNADLRQHVRDVLAMDWNVIVAADGQEALRLARQHAPDTIVTDQMMPRMSGRDLMRAIRDDQLLRETPVLFLTARAGTEARVESLESGADDYVTKPFNEAELRARVANLIRARQQTQQIAALNIRLEARVEMQIAELLRAGELLRYLPTAAADPLRADAAEPLIRRKVTVLSVRATDLAALMDAVEPQEFEATLDELWRSLLGVVIEHGGTPVHGGIDEIMALFGVRAAVEPSAQSSAAVAAAIAMRRRLSELRQAWRRRGPAPDIQLCAGIATGMCTVGSFRHGPEHLYGAVGHPARAARELQAAIAPGHIACASSTHAILEPRLRATRLTGTIDGYIVQAFDCAVENS